MGSQPEPIAPAGEHVLTRRMVETAIRFYLKDIHGVPWKGVTNVRFHSLGGDEEDVAAVAELAPGIKIGHPGSQCHHRRVGLTDGAGI